MGFKPKDKLDITNPPNLTKIMTFKIFQNKAIEIALKYNQSIDNIYVSCYSISNNPILYFISINSKIESERLHNPEDCLKSFEENIKHYLVNYVNDSKDMQLK
jgi:hypothetical protein